jgi:hypothetical protein
MRPKFCISRKKQQYLKQSLTLRFSHELHFVEQGRRIPQNADVAVSTEDAICLQKSTKLKLEKRRAQACWCREILMTNARLPTYTRFAIAASK